MISLEKKGLSDQQKKGCFGCFGILAVIIIAVDVITTIAIPSNDVKADKTFDFTAKEFETRVTQAVKKTNSSFLDIYESKDVKNGHQIQISDYMLLSAKEIEDENNVSLVKLAAHSDSLIWQQKELLNAFYLVLSTVDESLSVSQKYAVLEELGLSKISNDLQDHEGQYTINEVQYYYKGDIESGAMYLQATPK